MNNFKKIISENEGWLTERIFSYAEKHNYLRYFTNPVESFRNVICELSKSIILSMENIDILSENYSDDDYSKEIISYFDIREFKKQNSNDINLEISLGLLKNYRQCFVDLLFYCNMVKDDIEKYISFINRYFDRVEIGFTSQWYKYYREERIEKIESTARFLAQEKNKHISLLESISDPIILVDRYFNINYSNKAASLLFEGNEIPVKNITGAGVSKISDWLADNVKQFQDSNEVESSIQRKIVFKGYFKYYLVKMKKITGISVEKEQTYIIFNDITQIKDAEENLRRFAYIVEQSPVSIVITDKNGNIDYVNQKFTSVTGYKFNEVIHQNPRILKSGEKSSEEYKKLWENISSGKEWNGIFHNKRKNGELFWELASISPLRDQNGEIINYIAVKEDITETKKAEQAMLESEMQFRSVWENSYNGMRLTDENGLIVRVNGAFCQMFEMTKDLLEGMPISLTYFTDNRSKIIQKYKENFKNNIISTNIEKEMLLWNGKTKWFEISNVKIKLGNDQSLILSVFKDITENKLAEQFILKSQDKLRQSEKKYRQLVDTSQEGIWVTDENDKTTYMNKSLLRMLKYSNEEVLGKEMYDFVYEEDIALAKEKNLKRKNRIADQYEMRLVKKDGVIITTSISASAVMDDNGKYSGSLGILSDITGKKMIENALKYERHLFMALMDNIPDFIYFKDLDSKFTRINIAMAKWLGLKHPKEIIGKTDFDYYEEEAANIFFKDERKIIESGEGLYNYDEMSVTKTGKITWFIATKVPLKDQTGKIIGVFGISRDITDRKMMEKILWNEKEELNVTLRSVGEGVITTNKDEKILLLNKKAEEIIGFTQEEALNKELTEIFLMKDIKSGQLYINPIKHILRNENMDSIEGQSILIDNKNNERIISYNASAIFDRENNYIGFVIVFRDITEQTKLESQRALSQKMESIGQLAAGISHEINTPMQYIGDNTRFIKDSFNDLRQMLDCSEEILKTDVQNSDFEKNVEQLRKLREQIDIEYLKEEIPNAIEQSLTGIDRVRQIVLAMKDFAHPGIKTKALSNLNHGIEVTSTISRNEWKYVAEMETELDSSLPLVYCSMDEINQVVLNMIVNSSHSIKDKLDEGSTEKGKIKIKTQKEGNYAVIYISDTGKGIPKDLVNKIFDPFFTTKEVGKGTGQGLAIAHDIIVNKHKGIIQVDTMPGKGTMFSIRIPLTNESNE